MGPPTKEFKGSKGQGLKTGIRQEAVGNREKVFLEWQFVGSEAF
jgi:hypothetical protein